MNVYMYVAQDKRNKKQKPGNLLCLLCFRISVVFRQTRLRTHRPRAVRTSNEERARGDRNDNTKSPSIRIISPRLVDDCSAPLSLAYMGLEGREAPHGTWRAHTYTHTHKTECTAVLWYLVGGLRAERDEVPEHVGVLEVSLRVPLLGVDEAGTENKEYMYKNKS